MWTLNRVNDIDMKCWGELECILPTKNVVRKAAGWYIIRHIGKQKITQIECVFGHVCH